MADLIAFLNSLFVTDLNIGYWGMHLIFFERLAEILRN